MFTYCTVIVCTCITTAATTQRSKQRTAAITGIIFSVISLSLLLCGVAVSAGLLAHYSASREEHRSTLAPQNDTTDLGDYDRFLYSSVSVSVEEPKSTITVYQYDSPCSTVPVHGNYSYGYSDVVRKSAESTTGIRAASGYFAHGSEPTFQVNASGPMFIPKSECFAAFYLFNSLHYYCRFLLHNEKSHYIERLCFDVFNDTSKFDNKSIPLYIESSTYLYVGLYMHADVTQVSYNISGSQYYYNHTDLANSTNCVIDESNHECSFSLRSSLSARPTSDVCLLAHSAYAQNDEFICQTDFVHMNITATYHNQSSFPHNLAQLLALIFTCTTFLLALFSLVMLVLLSIYLYRY